MFENFRKRSRVEKDEPVDRMRRSMVLGGLASAAVGLGGTKVGMEDENPDLGKVQSVPDQLDDLAGPELVGEVEPMKTDSGHFYAERDEYAVEYVSELHIMENPEQLVALLKEHFDISAIPQAVLRQEVMENIEGLVLVESRYDAARVSGVGAFGVMQLMPETWKDLALPDEDPTNVIDQIKVAARYFVQTYRHLSKVCRNELEGITINHFDDNEEAMLKHFLGPALFGSYNSGMGNLEKIIKKFAQRYPTPNETVDMFDGVDIPTGYDVYLGMTRAAKDEDWRPSYKVHGSEYVAKVYGASQAMTSTT